MRFIFTLFGLLLISIMLVAHAAPELAAKQTDVEKLQEQVHVLDKDVGVFNAKLEAQDKRLQDIQSITAAQANHIAMVANQTTTLGNWIALASTLAAVFGVLVSYVTAGNRAKNWIKNNDQTLLAQIKDLEQQVELAKSHVKGRVEAFNQDVAGFQAELQDIAAKALDKNNGEALSQQDIEKLSKSNQALKEKPEKEFTAQEHFARGVFEFSNSRFEIALDAFDKAIIALDQAPASATHAPCLLAKAVTLDQLNRYEEAIDVYNLIDQRYNSDSMPAMRELVAKALGNKAFTLVQLNRSEEAIDVYNLIDQRYNSDSMPAMRELVAKAFNGKGFTHLMQAKQHFGTLDKRNACLTQALADLKQALEKCSNDHRAMVLGNLGYVEFLRGQSDTARAYTRECLELGKEKALHAQLTDAKLHRVYPDDSLYEALLNEIWQTLGNAPFNPDGASPTPA